MLRRSMKCGLQRIWTKWRHVGSVVAIVTMGATMSTGVEGRPLVASADYENVSFDELISVYKKAYAEAGFELKEQTIIKREARDGKKTTSLIFEYPNTDHPRMAKGVVSFLVVSPQSASQNCTPCSVYPQVFGGGALIQYDLEDYGRFMERMTAARARADEQIKMKLGKNASPARETN